MLSQLEHSTDERLFARDLDRPAMAGGTFDDLAVEPDLYSFVDGDNVKARSAIVLALGERHGDGLLMFISCSHRKLDLS
ncbi:hypothetical protein H6G65_12895 [Microcystis elabens FACHB-917]|nr:hypothetical protein [Microcystis elabens FACHB-917]